MVTRVEIISNQSIQDDILELLELHIPDFLYTIIPLAYGRGKNSRKLGDGIWPETNFVMFAYIKDEHVETVKKVVAAVKQKFDSEGVKLFFVKADEE